jgi:hypothetical protein
MDSAFVAAWMRWFDPSVVWGVTLAGIWLGLNLAAWSTLFEPLPPTSGWLWLVLIGAATIGAGMLARRLSLAWLVVLALAPGVAGWLVGWPQHRYHEPLLIPWWTDPAVFVVLLVGWLAAWLLPRRVAWAIDLQLDPRDVTPARPKLFDLATSSWSGIRLGDDTTRLRQRLGPPSVIDLDDRGTGDELWRYGRQVFHVRGPTVADIELTDPEAQTSAGVGIGDNLEIARPARAPRRPAPSS